jgi:hypothetical protein
LIEDRIKGSPSILQHKIFDQQSSLETTIELDKFFRETSQKLQETLIKKHDYKFDFEEKYKDF